MRQDARSQSIRTCRGIPLTTSPAKQDVDITAAAALSWSQKYPTHGLLYGDVIAVVPGFLQGLSVTRSFLAVLAAVGLLTGCSASSRVENIVPSWANTPPRQAMPQHQDRSDRGNSKPEVKKREQATPAPQGAVLEE
jgi:hypothetical protein